MAKERKRIFEQEMIQSKHKEEDERKLAELTADIDRKEISSLRLRKRVMTEVNEMQNKIDQERKDRHEDLIEMTEKETEVTHGLMLANNEYFENLMKTSNAGTSVVLANTNQQLEAAQTFAGGVSKLANDNKALAVAGVFLVGGGGGGGNSNDNKGGGIGS